MKEEGVFLFIAETPGSQTSVLTPMKFIADTDLMDAFCSPKRIKKILIQLSSLTYIEVRILNSGRSS